MKTSLFEDFFSYRPARGALGTGVGLAFVRRVISAHRGTVEEVGQETVGAEFRIEFPRVFQTSQNKDAIYVSTADC
jgi:signal transduction histidine kinase